MSLYTAQEDAEIVARYSSETLRSIADSLGRPRFALAIHVAGLIRRGLTKSY